MIHQLLGFLIQIQPSQSILLRSEKIFSVLAVLLIIFTGILIYLIVLNRKIVHLHKQMEDLKKDNNF